MERKIFFKSHLAKSLYPARNCHINVLSRPSIAGIKAWKLCFIKADHYEADQL